MKPSALRASCGALLSRHPPEAPQNAANRAGRSGFFRKKNENNDLVAERVGFEPTVPVKGTTVFETAPFDHSGTSPQWGPSAGRDAKRAPTQPGRSNPRH